MPSAVPVSASGFEEDRWTYRHLRAPPGGVFLPFLPRKSVLRPARPQGRMSCRAAIVTPARWACGRLFVKLFFLTDDTATGNE